MIHKDLLRRLGARSDQPLDLFNWLAPSYWEVMGQLSTHEDRHFEGTLRWLYLLPGLNSWIVGLDSPNVLWITALAGVGKSIIATPLISTLTANEPDMYIVYFFCKD